MPLEAPPIHAFNRAEITETLETGIKAIDGMLTIGIGQKIGILQDQVLVNQLCLE